MKYFNNFENKEDLKKQFRAYCVTMHPDRGGDSEAFKLMMSEYENISNNFARAAAQAREEEKMRQAAEEARKAEEERKRQAAEAERKAAEAMRPIIESWAGTLKSVKGLDEGNSYKHSSAYIAALKYNIKAVINRYYPDVHITVSIRNKAWREAVIIAWTDGPSVAQIKEIKELKYFIGWCHVSDPYEDYGHDERIQAHAAWCDAYGESPTEYPEYDRTISDLAKDEIRTKILEVFPQFDGADDIDGAFIGENEVHNIKKVLDVEFNVYRDISDNGYRGRNTRYKDLYNIFRAHYVVSDAVTKASKEAAEAPVFIPKHNKTWQAIKKALGSNVFGAKNDSYDYNVLSINEAAELLAQGSRVYLVQAMRYDGETRYYGVNLGGAKVQRKRAEKFAGVGVHVSDYGYTTYKDVEVLSFSAEVIAALRADAEEVKKQRQEWEEEQKNGKGEKQSGKTAARDVKTNTSASAQQAAQACVDDDTNEAPAAGLELVEIAGGVAVVGDSRITYQNRKQIKAHGATWNKEAQQWQAITADGVARLRAWFGVDDAAASCPNVEELTRAARLLADMVVMFNEMAQAIQAEEAQRQQENRTRKHQEAAQLRRDIANLAEQVAKMSDTLRSMTERLKALETDNEADTGASTQAQDGTHPAATGSPAQPSTAEGVDKRKGGVAGSPGKVDNSPGNGARAA